MDVSFWGPSGWQLLHLISFEDGNTESKKKLFHAMKDVLPCKYCRASANQFIKESPVDDNLPLWLYKFHDKVNQKLARQHADDPKVPMPKPSPPFEEVVRIYTTLLKKKPHTIPGRDFLLSIAFNFDPEHREAHQRFWKYLVKVFPYKIVLRFPDLTDNQKYLRSVYDMLKVKTPLENIKRQLAYYKSKCRKRTCKKTGGYIKKRNRALTYRLAHSRLL